VGQGLHRSSPLTAGVTTGDGQLLLTWRVMQVNLFSWRMIQAFLPPLKRSAHTRIVNVSSGAGSYADPAFGLAVRGGAAATYGISKAALNARRARSPQNWPQHRSS
jgi:short-subunit dehydrogenase involved in D-alanine esterification of teichoic acids